MSQRDLRPKSTSATPKSRHARAALSPEGFREDAHAVVIGINHYDDPRIPDLRFAAADAKRFHEVLTDPNLGRFRPENVALLLDGEATERRIRSAIGTDLPRRASADHTVCVFFAGHGAPVINARTGSSDGLEKYLLPHDALANDLRSSAIPMDDVNKFFDWIDTSQVIFFIDSCYSGVAGGRTFGPADYTMRAALTDEFLDDLAGEGRLVVTACAMNEVALEREDIGHGLFTYHLIQGLEGRADANKDGLVTLDELYDYVYRNVEQQARSMGGSMNPLRKGFVKGSVYLAQYETPAARRMREAMASAEAAFGRGDVDDAARLWREILDIDSANETARRGLETIEQRRADEEAERERLARVEAETLRKRQRVLLEHRKSGALSIGIFARGMEVIAKVDEQLDATDRMLREFTDALIDGDLNVIQYVQSVELLLADVVTAPLDVRSDETATGPPSAATSDVSHQSEPADTTPDDIETQTSAPIPQRIKTSVPDSPLASSEESRDSFIASPSQPQRTVLRRRSALIFPVAEAAAGLALLAFAGVRLQQNGPGPVTASLLPDQTAVVGIEFAGNGGDVTVPTVVARALMDLETALLSIPFLASAGVSSVPPLRNAERISIDVGGPPTWMNIESRRAVVSAGYFETLEVPLLRGRTFGASDAKTGARGVLEAVVNERMAEELWPGKDPIGEKLRYGGGTMRDVDPGSPSAAELTVVGVVANEGRSDGGINDPANAPTLRDDEMTFYVPYAQTPVPGPHYLVIRFSDPSIDVSDSTGDLASNVRGLIHKLIPGANVVSWTSGGDKADDRPMTRLVMLVILGMLGAIGLLHAARTIAVIWNQHQRPVGR